MTSRCFARKCRRSTCLFLGAAVALALAAAPARAETLGFVLTKWRNAGQFTPGGMIECPDGLNEESGQLPFHEGQGTVSNGFNLDGTRDGGATAATCRHEKFRSPDGIAGIDNQLYRAQACIRGARPDGPENDRIAAEIISNGLNRWLVEVTDVDDVVNDDRVEVMFAHGRDELMQAVDGKVVPGMSQRVDEKSAAYIFHTSGRIVNRTLITEPIQGLEIGQSAMGAQGTRSFLSARLKLDLEPDGARGVLGGYHDVERFHRFWAKTLGAHPANSAVNPLVSASVQRNADGMKNPKTGKCTAISAAYDLEFVRAFIVHEGSERSVAQSAVAQNVTPPSAAVAPPATPRAAEPKLANVTASPRLITEAQYLNTLRAIFGPGLAYPVKFAPVHRVGGLLAVGASSAQVTSGAFDQFDTAAQAIAAQVVGRDNRDFLIPCRPQTESGPDDACAEQFLTRVGPLLLRRPLTAGELKTYKAVARTSAERGRNFYDGLGVTLAVLLVSPDFLYVMQPVEAVGSRTRLTAYAKASRLSLLLWNAYPDQELLDAAANGAINTHKGLTAQVERMIASPRLESGVRNFFDDMLAFEAFETLAKDGRIYPVFTREVGEDAREQTLRTVVAHVVQDNADYRDLFTTRKTFLTGNLAAIYGVKAESPDDWTAFEFPPGDPRAGLLTHASFLALYAQPGRSSPTRRGKAIREIFLCQTVPNPPPNVDFSKLEDPGRIFRTARERLDAHRSNPVCAGCHNITDPIGLALENFDGAGVYRSQETRTPIDAGGRLDDVVFKEVSGLGQAMHDNPKTARCLSHRLASYALGRELKHDDEAWVDYITAAFAASGYRVKDLLRSIARSEAFYESPLPSRQAQRSGL